MGHRFLDLATSPAARTEQAARGSRGAYARGEGGPLHHDRLTPDEAAFIEHFKRDYEHPLKEIFE